MLLAVLAGAVAAVVPSAATTAAPRTIDDPVSRPLGAVTVIGDSVLLGSLLYSPTVVDHLADRGWGPIRAHAGEGYTTGYFTAAANFEASAWIARWRAEGWDAPNVMVNLGVNDAVFCGTDEGCAYRAILHLVDAIGPDHRIWWPLITSSSRYAAPAATWNRALERVVAERSNVTTWDWPAALLGGSFPASDGIHLTGDGYRTRSHMLAEHFSVSVAAGTRVGGDAPLPEPIGDPADYQPLVPTRVVDTRSDPPGRLTAGGTLRVDLSPHVPAGTTAVAVNLTSARTDREGFLTAHPCDRDRRDVSSVNHAAGVARGAMAIVPLSADGELCVFTHAAGHVVIDLQGAFVPEGLRFGAIAPERLVDTRESGRRNPVVVDVPSDADAVAVNLTAVRGDTNGFLTADACSSGGPSRSGPAEVSNVNYLPGEPVAGAAIVPVSAAGTICVWSSTSVDVVVDVTGVFSPDGGLRFQPAEPTRTLDVRDGTGGWQPVVGAGQVVDARVAPDVPMVTGTLTFVRPIDRGFAVAADCYRDDATSNVNAVGGTAMANAVTVALEPGGRLCVRSSTVAKVLFDTTGWWVPAE